VSAFGLDPEELWLRRRARVVNGIPKRGRGWLWLLLVLVVLFVLGSVGLSLRVKFLYLDSLGYGNVFWTPIWAHLWLFLTGFAVAGLLMALNIPWWRSAIVKLDRQGNYPASLPGVAISLLVALGVGIFLSGAWQDVVLWQHQHSFGFADPAFGLDMSFFVFNLPLFDDLQGIAWALVLISLIVSAIIFMGSVGIGFVPEGVRGALHGPSHDDSRAAARTAANHLGVLLCLLFLLAALGAHFGAYHLATDQHDVFVGLDATERNVTRPILGGLQWIAVLFAVALAAVMFIRRNSDPLRSVSWFAGLFVLWMVLAGLLQTIPGAVYQATTVTPNALQAQSQPITDYLSNSRAAWGLQGTTNVEQRAFGAPVAATVADLQSEPGTLQNVRIQDYRELPDTLRQLDTRQSYQTYPTITIDRYAAPGGSPAEVMIGPREISEHDIPQGFVNQSFIYTHGYGLTAASVNNVSAEGNPQILAGKMPLQQIICGAPPNLACNSDGTPVVPASGIDPRIYCGMATTQPVVANTTQQEFDYPIGGGNAAYTPHGTGTTGISIDNPIDKLAVSWNAFSGLDLFLTNAVTADSRVLLHRQVSDRLAAIAPFLRPDGDPYMVVDQTSGHLVWVVDAYVVNSNVPESYQYTFRSDGAVASYMRNAVKMVVDGRTCATTLYVTDATEPIIAAYSDIFPGVFQPLSKMPAGLLAHLRYPEGFFQAQVQAYGTVHIQNPSVLFNRTDLWRPSDEEINGQRQPTQAYYVELTLPDDKQPSFVLLQTFSPATSESGVTNDNMVAWLAAQCDYTKGQPKLVGVPLNNAATVLGPMQFDRNIKTDRRLSPQITLLSQQGSTVTLGNVIVLPFANHSFLYVRPFYVIAGSSSFPQLKYVVVSDGKTIGYGQSFEAALEDLFATAQNITGTSAPVVTQSSPGATPTPAPTVTFTSQEIALVQDWLSHESKYEQDLASGNFTSAGQEQAAMKADADQLRTLIGSH
jgi:uncharacterized membrane protein (UPF0182 family)